MLIKAKIKIALNVKVKKATGELGVQNVQEFESYDGEKTLE